MSLIKKRNEPLTPAGERYDYVALCNASDDDLEDVMWMGVRPDPLVLAGWEFRGWNTADITYAIANKKFKKGFFKKGGSDVGGYNVVVVQNQLGDPWIDKLKGTDAMRHSFYDVYPVKLDEVDHRYPNAVLLNYGVSEKNFMLNPARFLRDYLVQVYEDNPDLYLGKAYAAVGPFRMFQSFFILEKNNPSLL
jgi:hypothetical protein